MAIKNPSINPSTYRSLFKEDAFAGKTVLITGGGSGIGRCIVHELASLSANILLLGRSEKKLQQVQAEIREDNAAASCEWASADIRDSEAVNHAIKSLLEKCGKIDGLVNNAGGQFPACLEDISSNGFLAVLRTNLLGTFNVAKEVYTESMRQHGGSIVNITADYFSVVPKMGHSGAARAGVENLTYTSAIEWAKSGVRVNNIAPGYIASSGMDSYEDQEMQARIPKFKESIPWGRMGTESEISAAVCFLLSDAASYITGTTLQVDGGSSLCLSSPLYDLETATENNESFKGFHRAQTPKILRQEKS